VATEGGANVALAGKQLTLAPHLLGSLGLVYASDHGFEGSLVANQIGPRFLDLANTARAAAYSTVDAAAGYQLGEYGIRVSVRNVGNRRVPVTQSEFGDSSYYLLPARSLFVEIHRDFRKSSAW
jgi:outer membrane receptor protein involved in Fe transport